tara:strand:+ start:277 stop:648 length:372 start_codon:yes stop_codon:yes gene_type:complete
MRNFGHLKAKKSGKAKAPYKNYGPPDHFRFGLKGDYERIPFYRSPHYGQLTSTDATKIATIGGAGLLIAGALLFMPLAVWPFIIKGFRPDLSYGRRVGIGLGISIGLAAVTGVARAALSKKES